MTNITSATRNEITGSKVSKYPADMHGEDPECISILRMLCL